VEEALGNRDGDEIIGQIKTGELGLGEATLEAGPADPEQWIFLSDGGQRRGQPTNTTVSDEAGGGVGNIDRQPIGNNNDSCLRHGVGPKCGEQWTST